MCPTQTGERLAQRAAGKHVLEAERFERVEQHDIEIASQPAVLESVIQQQSVADGIPESPLSRSHAIAVLNMRHVRQCMGKLQCFVVVLGRRCSRSRG